MSHALKFPNRIKALRLQKGLSREHVAAMTEMSWRHYVRIENGTTDPSANKLRHIARVLECSVDDLYV